MILGLAKPVLQTDGTERTLQPITLVIDNGVDAAPSWEMCIKIAETLKDFHGGDWSSCDFTLRQRLLKLGNLSFGEIGIVVEIEFLQLR